MYLFRLDVLKLQMSFKSLSFLVLGNKFITCSFTYKGYGEYYLLSAINIIFGLICILHTAYYNFAYVNM